ncbi:DUF4435 domain-containing protein, partial [Curvivirga aplysinae]|uniref:DUF4435 domain-containing protein n=1 Tax=Curvivirga aplysinae TaxID=2529852 RepID=UPI0012BB7DC1
MSHLAKMRESRRTLNSVLLKFRTAISPKRKQFFSFFEGEEDIVFYSKLIKKHTPSDVENHFIICDGKKGVLDVRDLLAKRFPQILNVSFFVDKDHDEYVGNTRAISNDTFVTCQYSIENYLCSRSVINHFLTEHILLAEDELISTETINSFENSYKIFEDKMRPLSAMIIALRRRRATTNLNNLVLKNLFKFDKNLNLIPQTKRSSTLIRQITNDKKGASYAEVAPINRDLKLKHAKTFIRGKYDLWFLIE